MHEFYVAAEHGPGTARDIAKRILDFGMHAPTVYFPLIVQEALMIEPTETEDLATLDRFAEVMEHIRPRTGGRSRDGAHGAPLHACTAAGRGRAARDPILRWSPEREV